MARPKKITKVTETAYFKDVTPLWVAPGREHVEPRYHDSVDALVEWIGPDWIDNNTTNFFPMRQFLIKSCESWANHDWEQDARLIEIRRMNAKHRPELERTFAKFVSALGKAPFRDTKRMLGLAFLSEFGIKQPSRMTSHEGIEAVDQATEWFGQYLKGKDRGFSRFGAIQYQGIPRQLPRKEVAIALSLASQITFLRRDGLTDGSHNSPRKPRLSARLPWKAIALFASANCDDPASELDVSAIQTLVTSLARKVALVDWYGPKNG